MDDEDEEEFEWPCCDCCGCELMSCEEDDGLCVDCMQSWEYAE